MLLDLITFDPGQPARTPEDFALTVARQVQSRWDSGADLVLLPEFLWLGLEALLPATPKATRLTEVARYFWNKLMPGLKHELSRAGKGVVLGTCPALHRGGLRNRAPIFTGSAWATQDKLHLTPWEKQFTTGNRLHIWNFGDWRVAVLICLDIEIPELACRLRGSGVDLILCPSATETELGVERVDRCASARAVELGCHVGVAHLTGKAASELIDKNLGRAAWYGPSQHVYHDQPRWIEGGIIEEGTQVLRVPLDAGALKRMRRMRSETNPANLGPVLAGMKRRIPLKSH